MDMYYMVSTVPENQPSAAHTRLNASFRRLLRVCLDSQKILQNFLPWPTKVLHHLHIKSEDRK